ncbi:hypothetical protein NDU88_002879 [Pleurodeles waltl]|uniref:Secreted protein n=1 Tax=Pleurodeles waltl TaxID=8319 RepID=A0AAV7VDR8_PLEWA|nr:hypothetical protein NDU88_002879 [Pleurodeles waltl]
MSHLAASLLRSALSLGALHTCTEGPTPQESFSCRSCVHGPTHRGPGLGAERRRPQRSLSTRGGRRASQLPSGARSESCSRPLLDSRASINQDGGDLLASQGILRFFRAPAQMHSGAQVVRSPPPHRKHGSPLVGPRGARVPDRRAGASDILHRAVVPAGEPPTSVSAERRGPGRHFEFIEPAAAGAITARICRRWFQGGSLGSRSRWAPPGQRQQCELWQLRTADDGGVQSTLRVRPPS